MRGSKAQACSEDRNPHPALSLGRERRDGIQRAGYYLAKSACHAEALAKRNDLASFIFVQVLEQLLS